MLNLRTLFLAGGLCIAATAVDARPVAAQATITCESQNNNFRDCRIATGGKARLVQNISNTRCDYGRTWGFDWNSIWVDRGCRGKFMVNGSGSGWQSGNWGQRVRCESRNGSFKICNVSTYGYVRLVRQISQSACVAGRTWGYQNNQIWVGNGCRADFEVGSGDSNWEGGARVVTCGSSDGRYSRCFTRTEGTVSLRKQLSNQACVYRRTWGYDQNGIWVDNGCRGQFVVGRGGPGSGWGEYPGTWPGPGVPGGGLVQRGSDACRNRANSMGYQGVAVTNARQNGSNVTVMMNARSQNRPWMLTCLYRQSNGTATVTEQKEAGSGGGSSNLYGNAKVACENRAKLQGYQVIGSGPAKMQSGGVKHDLDLRKGGLQYSNAYCNYHASSYTATLVAGNPDKQAR
jgi:hypothetical protein